MWGIRRRALALVFPSSIRNRVAHICPLLANVGNTTPCPCSCLPFLNPQPGGPYLPAFGKCGEHDAVLLLLSFLPQSATGWPIFARLWQMWGTRRRALALVFPSSIRNRVAHICPLLANVGNTTPCPCSCLSFLNPQPGGPYLPAFGKCGEHDAVPLLVSSLPQSATGWPIFARFWQMWGTRRSQSISICSCLCTCSYSCLSTCSFHI